MNKNIGFPVPPVRLDCGEEVGIPLDAMATLRSAGVRQIRVEKCWRCQQEHIADLPDLTVITVQVHSDLSIPRPNGR